MKVRKLDTPIVLALFAFLSSYPYILECFIKIPYVKIVAPILTVICFFMIAESRKNKNNAILYDAMLMCIVSQVVLWFFYSFIHNDTTYLSRIFFVFYTLSIMVLLAIRGDLVRFIHIHNWIVAIQAILSLVAFILVYIGVLGPILNYTLQDGRPGVSFILTNTTAYYGNVIRAAGYFDEPGALGFWGTYALIFNKLFINNKQVEYLLIIGLFSTLSAGYFVSLALYILFFYNKPNVKSIFRIILVIIPFFILFNYLSSDDILARYTSDRFQNGEIRSARYEYAENAKKMFIESPIIGHGAQYILDKGQLEDNPYEVLAKDGVLGYIVLYAPLFLPLLFVRKKEIVFATIILFAGYMQRPFHVNLMHFFHIYAFCLLAYMVFREQKTKPYYSQKDTNPI